jgi:hypothetical protein
MPSNLDRYTKDLEALIARGDLLDMAMHRDCTADFDKNFLKTYGDSGKKILKDLPTFRAEYQSWYSEAKHLIKQVLPDRLDDFVRHYEKPKSRKELTSENYRIEDYLQGITVTRLHEPQPVVGFHAAIPHFKQQLAIVKAVKRRFESSLFDIRQLVQADVFDSELDAAKELAKKGFARAAGALAGVVLERHLGLVAVSHAVKSKVMSSMFRRGERFSISPTSATCATTVRAPSPRASRSKT